MLPNHTHALIVLDVQNVYTNPDSELFCKKSDKTIEQIGRERGERLDDLRDALEFFDGKILRRADFAD